MLLHLLKVIVGAAVIMCALLGMVSCGHDWDKKDCARLAVELETRTKFVLGKCHVLPVVIVRE